MLSMQFVCLSVWLSFCEQIAHKGVYRCRPNTVGIDKG